MSTYEQITLTSNKRIILENPRERYIPKLGVTCVLGTEVNREGDTGRVERIHMIQMEMIRSRRPMQMNLHYAVLEVAR